MGTLSCTTRGSPKSSFFTSFYLSILGVPALPTACLPSWTPGSRGRLGLPTVAATFVGKMFLSAFPILSGKKIFPQSPSFSAIYSSASLHHTFTPKRITHKDKETIVCVFGHSRGGGRGGGHSPAHSQTLGRAVRLRST